MGASSFARHSSSLQPVSDFGVNRHALTHLLAMHALSRTLAFNAVELIPIECTIRISYDIDLECVMYTTDQGHVAYCVV